MRLCEFRDKNDLIIGGGYTNRSARFPRRGA
jgi:hypothetical protein